MSAYDQHTVQLAINDYLVGIGPLIIGICIVALLIAAVWFGRKRIAGEPPVPRDRGPRAGAWQTREEHDRGAPEDHGPGHQDSPPRTHESRQPVPDEVPRDGRRRYPHEISPYGVRQGRVRTRPRRHSGPNID
jgi:hypothetical protein